MGCPILKCCFITGAIHDASIWKKTIARGRLRLKKKEKIMGVFYLFLVPSVIIFLCRAGDPAYKGLPHTIVKYPVKKLCCLLHGPLPKGCKCNCPKGRTPDEKFYNHIFDGVRGRVEKILGQVVHHKVRLPSHVHLIQHSFPMSLLNVLHFPSPSHTLTRTQQAFNNVMNRKHFNYLVACVKVTLHLTALWSRVYPQFRGFENGGHFD